MLFPLIKFGEFQVGWLEFQFTLTFWLALGENIYFHFIPAFWNYSNFAMIEVVTQITTFSPQEYDRKVYWWCCMSRTKLVLHKTSLPRLNSSPPGGSNGAARVRWVAIDLVFPLLVREDPTRYLNAQPQELKQRLKFNFSVYFTLDSILFNDGPVDRD